MDGFTVDININTYRHSIERMNQWVFTVTLKGRIDQENNSPFNGIINILIKGGARYIIFDFLDLQYIDSTGLGTVINAAKKVRQMEGKIAIVAMNPTLMQVFELVNLSSFIPIFKSINEAANTIRV